MTIKRIIEKYAAEWRKSFGALAVGYGYKTVRGKSTSEKSLIFSVRRKLKGGEFGEVNIIPNILENVVTDVIETHGEITAPPPAAPRHAGAMEKKPTEKWRPAPGGVSVGHPLITAGTLGCYMLRRGDDPIVVILSNNHVLANSNKAEIGDLIIQPGKYDGGVTARDEIAELYDFVPIHFTGTTPPTECPITNGIASILNGFASLFGRKSRIAATQETRNTVDAAIARPLDMADVDPNILEIGIPVGVADAHLGDTVKKFGRTTTLTHDSIDQVNVSVQVSYGDGKVAVMEDQMIAGAMSAGGDSGSAVLNSGNKVVGLLFAGSETLTVINRIEHVMTELELDDIYRGS